MHDVRIRYRANTFIQRLRLVESRMMKKEATMTQSSIQRLLLFALVLVAFSLLFSRTILAQDARLTGDASVSSGAPNTNNGGSATMIIRGGATVHRGFIKFDLSNLPLGTTASQVAKAVLTVYVASLGGAGSMNVVVVNGAWNEGTITNAN